MTNINENEKIEIDLLLQAIYMKYGYDFKNYAKASIRRRVQHMMSGSGLDTVAHMIHKLLYDKAFFDTLLLALTVNVTEMFRDPPFFKILRDTVLPHLETHPFIKVWNAGCSTGEEVYSTAILLGEEGLGEHARIYATDANESVLAKAREGVFHIDRMKEYTRNYSKAGGLASFSDYYTARYDLAIMHKALKKNIVFSHHNLVTDSVFGEMNLIICRNVLIYFNTDLQERVFELFYQSLTPGGFLCLGSKETVRFSKYSDHFENVVPNEKIYKKR